MAGQAKENLPVGSLKYLFVYLKIRIFKCSYRIYIYNVHIPIYLCDKTCTNIYIYMCVHACIYTTWTERHSQWYHGWFQFPLLPYQLRSSGSWQFPTNSVEVPLPVSLVIARVSVPECFTDHTLAHQELVLHLEVDVPYYHMLVAACWYNSCASFIIFLYWCWFGTSEDQKQQQQHQQQQQQQQLLLLLLLLLLPHCYNNKYATCAATF